MRFARWGLLALAGMAAADVIPVIGAQDAVSFPLPPGAGDSLLLELDGYDVTAISQVRNGRVEIPLEGLALEPGEHYLLLQSARANGDIELLAEHTLDVFAREGVRASSNQTQLLLGTHHRVAESPEEEFAGSDRSQQTAALQWSAEIDHSRWVAGGAAAVLFDSDRTASFDGDRWQLPSVDLRVGRRFSRGSVLFGFGDTEAGESNLLFGGFNRRGLRIEADALEGRLDAQLFTLHANPVTGFDADIPPFDDSSSVIGAHAVVAPLSKHPGWLRFSASWLDGDSTLGGAGVYLSDDGDGIADSVGGDASMLALDSFPFEGGVWLRGEYANSSFDADGREFGEPALDATARRFVAQLSSAGTLRVPALEQWLLGFESQRVDPHFYSLGNLLLPNDLDYRQVHTELALHGWNLSARWLDQFTDVDDEPLTPRIDSVQHALSLDYTLPVADPDSGVWKWLGTPTFRMARETTDNQLRDADVALAAFDIDNRQRSVSAGVDFSHEQFTLGFMFERVERDDRSQPLVIDDFVLYEPSPDSTEKLFGVNLSWTPGERLSVSPQWQRSRLREVEGGSFDNDLWSIQFQAELIPSTLSAQFGWSESSDEQRFFELPQDAQRLSSSNGNLDLSYRMKLLTFHLRGAYGHNAMRTPLSQETGDQWQAQLSVELNWEQP